MSGREGGTSGTLIPPVQPSSPPSKSSVSSSELLSMLKKVPSKEDPAILPPPQIQDDRGMLGLLQLIKATGSAINLAAVGIDLESLGLALDSADNINRDWEYPFSSSRSDNQADSRIPACYLLPSSIVLNPSSKLPHFTDETLLYIFYGMPRDRMQELAARELTSRSWRYHRELQQWLTVEGNGTEVGAGARYPPSRTFTVFFDVSTWTRNKRETTIERDDQIDDRFLKR
jgi:CCR4-NOT transcription complex subunit 2